MRCFYLFITFLCLVFGHSNLIFAKNIATTDKPCSENDSDYFLNIQTKLLEIQDDIFSIIAAMGITENMDDITVKINATDEEYQNIRDELISDDLKQQLTECNKDAKALIDNLFEAVTAHIKNLRINFGAYKQKRLPLDAIEDIKALRFELAEEKLKQMKDYEQITTIIQDSSDNCTDNYENLTKLVESLTDVDVIYMFVRTLIHEMRINDHKNPYQWMRLAKKLETQVLENSSVQYFTKQYAQFTDDFIRNLIRNYTLEALNASIRISYGQQFVSNEELQNLTTALYLFDPVESESVIKQFVNTNYGQISAKKILTAINGHKFIEQKIAGVSELFKDIEQAKNLNSDVTLKIAANLHDIRSHSDFAKLNKTRQNEVDKVVEKLPVCARNLFFLPAVCLWNKEKEEYLTAGDLTTRHDMERRNIFTTDPMPESHWYVTTKGDNFLFSSRSFNEEYMYAAAFDFNQDLRYVFNWIQGRNTDIQSEWSIELNDDYCYIKSVAYNEYLFASNHLRPVGKNLRNVFTWKLGSSILVPKFQWQVRKCQ